MDEILPVQTLLAHTTRGRRALTSSPCPPGVNVEAVLSEGGVHMVNILPVNIEIRGREGVEPTL